ELLVPLRERATMVIDTTRISVHELRRRIVAHFGPGASELARMRTRIVSFGFKYGAPVDADVLLDVRFLDNPFFVEELQNLPGTEERVRRHVLEGKDCKEFLARSVSFLEFCLPRFEREGKSYATIGIGCTGGQHRSVVIADVLAEALHAELGLSIDVVHRDMERHNNERAQAATESG